jgi:hypothetical protein
MTCLGRPAILQRQHGAIYHTTRTVTPLETSANDAGARAKVKHVLGHLDAIRLVRHPRLDRVAVDDTLALRVCESKSILNEKTALLLMFIF